MGRPPKKVTAPTGKKVEIEEHGVSGKDPFFSTPGSEYWRRYQAWLGQFDPEMISINTMLKMRTHPAIALGTQIIAAPLINAEWDIECNNPMLKEFLKAVIQPIYLKLLLYSLSSIEIGFAAFTKQWSPQDVFDKNGARVGPANSLPVVISNLKVLSPLTVRPEIENDTFKGIIQGGTRIEPMYSAWITHARHRVWGNLWGYPLLTNAYKLWWSSCFRQGLRDRHIEDRISPSAVIRYPQGHEEDPGTGARLSHRDVAISVGKSMRAGETIALPSDVHGEELDKYGGAYKWDAKFLEKGENVDAFIKLDDADDQRMFMALLVPPGSVLQGKGGLGSQSVAETLGRLFWETQWIRKQELDQQFTEYIVQPLIDVNFGEGTARLVTRRFMRSDEELMASLLRIVANRQDIFVDSVIDIKEIGNIMKIPMPKGKVITKVQGGVGAGEQLPGAQPGMSIYDSPEFQATRQLGFGMVEEE